MIVENILSYIETFLHENNIDKKYVGNALQIFHIIFIIILLYLIFFGPVNRYLYISMLFAIIILLSNYLLEGCILTKIERKLLNDENWNDSSGYHLNKLLNLLHIETTKEFIINLFYCIVILCIIVCIIRIVIN